MEALNKVKIADTIMALESIGWPHGFRQVSVEANDYDDEGKVKKWNNGEDACKHPIQQISMYNENEDIYLSLLSEDCGDVVIEQHLDNRDIINHGSRSGFSRAARYAMILHTKRIFKRK